MNQREAHHSRQGYLRAMLGRSKDKRRRNKANAAAYSSGYARGEEMCKKIINHGLMQKIGDAMSSSENVEKMKKMLEAWKWK